MEKEKIIEMLKDIIKNVDYDIYKDLFIHPEEPDLTEKQLEKLVSIVKKYL